MNTLNNNRIHKLARAAAVVYLEELSISDFLGPILEEIVKIKGIKLIYDTIDDHEAEGFSAKKYDENFIFINTNFNPRLQTFTIAHEIYHLDDSIMQLPDIKEDERAADHFAANILLPDKVVLEKYRILKNLEYNDIEVFFKLSDLSRVPYETLYKRYKELSLSVVKIDKELVKIEINSRNPYLKEFEQKLQILREIRRIRKSRWDQVNPKKEFEALEILVAALNDVSDGLDLKND